MAQVVAVAKDGRRDMGHGIVARKLDHRFRAHVPPIDRQFEAFQRGGLGHAGEQVGGRDARHARAGRGDVMQLGTGGEVGLDHHVAARAEQPVFQQRQLGPFFKPQDVMDDHVGARVRGTIQDLHRTVGLAGDADHRAVGGNGRVQRGEGAPHRLLALGFQHAIGFGDPVAGLRVGLSQRGDLHPG